MLYINVKNLQEIWFYYKFGFITNIASAADKRSINIIIEIHNEKIAICIPSNFFFLIVLIAIMDMIKVTISKRGYKYQKGRITTLNIRGIK